MLAHEEGARILLSHCSKGSASRLCGEVIYLSGYVAECSLKSMLFRWTPASRWQRLFDSFKNPKGLGHDLVKLRAALLRAGCPISEDVNRHLYRVGNMWSTQLRYDPKSRTPNDAEAVYDSAKAILDCVREVS